MAQGLDSEVDSSCFDENMKEALRSHREYMVENLEVDKLWDHLEDAFPDGYLKFIQAKPTREKRARGLLDHMVKRHASVFWKFVTALLQPDVDERHIAERILVKYEQLGGQVTEPVEQLRKVYVQL